MWSLTSVSQICLNTWRGSYPLRRPTSHACNLPSACQTEKHQVRKIFISQGIGKQVYHSQCWKLHYEKSPNLSPSVRLEAWVKGELKAGHQLLVINSCVQAAKDCSRNHHGIHICAWQHIAKIYEGGKLAVYLLSVVHFSVRESPCSLILYFVSREPVTCSTSQMQQKYRCYIPTFPPSVVVLPPAVNSTPLLVLLFTSNLTRPKW